MADFGRRLADPAELNLVYQSKRTLVYRVPLSTSREEGPAAIAKVLAGDFPALENLAQLRQEYAILQRLTLPGVGRVLALVNVGNGLALVMEDLGGAALTLVANAAPRPIEQVLDLGVKLATIVAEVHARGFLHLDINPTNLVWNPDSEALQLIDFGLAREVSADVVITAPLGTLAYMAPEQTGRSGLPLDERSDLYSVGMALYAMATGHAPYPSEEPAELIHAQLASPLVYTSEEEAAIPQLLRDLVKKATAKAPAERYQSARGMLHDLQLMLNAWRERRDLPALRLAAGGTHVAGGGGLRGALYGRSDALSSLEATIFAQLPTSRLLLLLRGAPGLGKSALMEAVGPMLRRRGCRFWRGRFEGLGQNAPYSAWAQALTAHIQALLSGTDAELASVKQRLIKACAGNGALLVAMIPEAALLLDEQAPVQALPPAESLHRFHWLFVRILAALATADAPLVLFLDDLQWADGASLKLLEAAETADLSANLVVVAAFRDEEVAASAPLTTLLSQFPAQPTLSVEPLGVEAVAQWLTAAFALTRAAATEWAKLFAAKTGGNPFALQQLIHELQETKILRFEPTADQGHGAWTCDLAALRELPVASNLLAAVTARLDQLSDQTRRLLGAAACVGSRFDLRRLAVATGQTAETLAELLRPAVAAGVIFGQTLQSANETYLFSHDRLQQAVYNLLPAHDRAICHRFLALDQPDAKTPGSSPKSMFALADHLSQGIGAAVNRAERMEFASLLLNASRLAKSAAAYDTAYRYLRASAKAFVGEEFAAAYDLQLAILTELAEAAYLCDDFATSQAHIERVLKEARRLAEKIPVYLIRINSLVARREMRAAVGVGLEALRLLGEPLPRRARPWHLLTSLVRLKRALSRYEVKALADLPLMQDEAKLSACKIMNVIMAPVFIACPELFPLLVFRLVAVSLRFGNCAYSPLGYAGYGLACCAFFGQIELGYRFGELARSLAAQFGDVSVRVQVNHVFFHYIDHWRRPLRAGLPQILQDCDEALQVGDQTYAAYNKFLYSYHQLFSGNSLHEVRAKMELHDRDIVKLRQEQMLQGHQIYHQLVHNLLGLVPDPKRLSGDVLKEDAALASALASANLLAVFGIHSSRLMLAVLFGDYTSALSHAAACRPYLKNVGGMTIGVLYHFHAGLAAALAAAGTEGALPRATLLRQAKAHHGKLRKWAEHCPENYGARALLVEAAHLEGKGKPYVAARIYANAARSAKEHGMLYEEALSYDLLASLWQGLGDSHVALVYAHAAHHGYGRWGAEAKMVLLVEKYPGLVRALETGDLRAPSSSTLKAREGFNEALDLGAVLRASQLISGEISLNQLLGKIMRVVIANAGAETGSLLLKNGDDWRIEAEATVHADDVSVMTSTSPEGRVPEAVIAFVERVKTAAVYADASASPFAGDPYIQKYQPQSIFCLPLAIQGRLVGLLYLEHRHATGAFTKERVDLLSMISSQAAVAIDNARLYNDLEHRVEQRTRELTDAMHELSTTQSRLVQAEKMAALGGLVAGVAHEINTPLGIGVTAASTLVDEAGKFRSAVDTGVKKTQLYAFLGAVDELGGILLNSLRNAGRLTDTFKKVAASGGHDESSVFAVEPILAELMPGLRLQLRGAGHTLDFSCEGAANLRGDPGEFGQIVSNLVLNAFHHAFDQPTPGHVEVLVKGTDNAVELIVKDDGKGIPEGSLKQIYDPFFTTGRGLGRAGLGLNIVYSLVTQKFLGTIECRSVVGKGTEFHLHFPLAEVSPAASGSRLRA